jgi:deferrochelatase/peroxidase EfeB
MPDVATSLHLHNVHELTLLVPVKDGFVQQNERRISYATRLNRLLSLLFRPAQGVAERSLMPANSFADSLQNIYHFDYGVVERLQQSQLILSATFDSSWETYFHNLVDEVGDFLDAVFCHCKGFEGRSCADGYEAFSDFIRDNQVQTGVLYTASPDLTTDDLRILRRIARGETLKEPAAELADQIGTDKKLWTKRYKSPAWQGGAEYKRLRLQGISQFFHSVWETRRLFSADEQIDDKRARDAGQGRSAQVAFDNVAKLLARPIFESAEFSDSELTKVLLDTPDPDRAKWLGGIVETFKHGKAPRRASRHDHPLQEPTIENVQDNIVEDVKSNAALLTLLRFPTKDPTGFLRRLRKDLVDSSKQPIHINVGFTYAGLRRLGLGDETLELFPKEFQEGMELRAGTLGDVGWPNHPDYWRPTGMNGWFSISSVDLVVVFHSKLDDLDGDIRDSAKELLRTWIGRDDDSCLVHEEVLKTRERNPFGFKHQESNQPKIDWNYKEGKDFDNRIAGGDVILGYPDRRGEVARVACGKCSSTYSDLFKDGTFLVVRKLAQHPDAFKRFRKDAKRLGSESTTLGKVFGAHKLYPERGDVKYPRIAHRRRANPRFQGSPRIVRRSFSYSGPSTDNGAGPGRQEQGHMFMCYCASIAQQYEMLQRWINGGNGTNLLSTKSDLVGGEHVPHTFPINADGKRPHTPHVTLRWGMYLFVPSKPALEQLIDIARFNEYPASDLREKIGALEAERRIERGGKLIKQLDAIKDPEVAKQSWKQLFEEPTSARDSQAVWTVIRKSGAPKRTDYGVLVADVKTAALVLEDTGTQFSVSKYRERFKKFGGEFYLGLDAAVGVAAANGAGAVADANAVPGQNAGGDLNLAAGCPVAKPQPAVQPSPAFSYKALARANDEFHRALSPQDAFEAAHKYAAEFLRRDPPTRIDLRDLARQVVGKISADYIGIPSKIAANDVELRNFLDHFINITRYSSFPFPEDWVREKGINSGKELERAYGTNAKDWSGVGQTLVDTNYANGDKDRIRDAIVIGNIGFVPPALSMLVGMLTKWLGNGDIQQPLLRDPAGARAAVVREMKYDSTFTTMYRTGVAGNGLAEPGFPVVVGIQSAYVDAKNAGADPQRWMFGGAFGKGAHACPMQPQAIEILAGAVVALAEHIAEQAKENRALVRLGPVTYELETVGRILPGLDLDPKRGKRRAIRAQNGAGVLKSVTQFTSLTTATARRLMAAKF